MGLLKKYIYYFYSIFEIVFNVKNWPKALSLLFQKWTNGETTIKLRRPPIRIIVRGGMDVWSIKETFFDAFYARYGVPIQDGWVVVDIGAGIGDFSMFAAYEYPNTKVYAFEPFPESYQLLVKNLTLNAVGNVLTYQEAVWHEAGDLVLDLSAGEPLKIFSQEFNSALDDADKVMVESVSLRDVLTRHHINQIDLLKLDCEGAEYEILMKAPSTTLVKIKRIIMEYHDLDENHRHPLLISHLENEGYFVRRFENQAHRDIGYLFAYRDYQVITV